MKLPLKYIATIVVGSVTSIFCYQVYWLMGLYRTQKQEAVVHIEDAMATSDYNELIARIHSLQPNPHKEISITLSTVDEEEDLFPERTPIMKTLSDKRNPMLQFAADLQNAQHEQFDPLVKPSIETYDRYLTAQLAAYGISTSYSLAFTQGEDSVLAQVQSRDYKASVRNDTYCYVANAGTNLVYVLTLDSLSSIVLRQMVGILLTSFIILLIIVFAFWYLIHTLLRQKSLEEMKSDFTNNITHELKTPVAVAYAASDALLNPKKPLTEEKLNRYLGVIQQQLKRLGGMVEQILTMSMEQRRTMTLHEERVNVAELLANIIAQQQLKATKNVAFTTDIQPANLCISADRTHLSNMVDNLIDNAIKYSGTEAHVAVVARDRLLSVADEGIGIATAAQPYVFDKFYRVPTGNLHDVKGYGLGLFYVKTMMEKHGGRVSLHSEPGKGSTFTLHFEKQQNKDGKS